MRDSDVGKVGIDDLYDLIIIRTYALKLEIKVIQPHDKLRLRGIASDDYELLDEDPFDNKTAAVMLQSALQSSSLKRIFCSSLRRKEYL